jgi:hypothetical protein
LVCFSHREVHSGMPIEELLSTVFGRKRARVEFAKGILDGVVLNPKRELLDSEMAALYKAQAPAQLSDEVKKGQRRSKGKFYNVLNTLVTLGMLDYDAVRKSYRTSSNFASALERMKESYKNWYVKV